ncbi:crossover junction endodeoxyribonuclease RuvC [Sinimarinibacterium thermocellulolyticum]|uniref:Crossover junction endodeoxyribonuclease RuvC n=1 Tax=Sinimarinibacterium thermocellulolyticum TaxID=3170016 RepID=A0ABV2A8I9_9GAMM
MTRILGIDPGSRYTGYGVIDTERGQSRLVVCGRIVAGTGAMPDRLVAIERELAGIVHEHAPQEAAFEEVFVDRNVRSALVLGQARGVALCVVARTGLPIAEYAPAQVKMALTGNGRADKEQVQHMVKLLLKLHGRLVADAADALAVALTHAQVRGVRQRSAVSLAGSGRKHR